MEQALGGLGMKQAAVLFGSKCVPEYGPNMRINEPQSPPSRMNFTGCCRHASDAWRPASGGLNLAHRLGVGHHRIHMGHLLPEFAPGASRTVCSTRSSRATWHEALQPHQGTETVPISILSTSTG